MHNRAEKHDYSTPNYLVWVEPMQEFRLRFCLQTMFDDLLLDISQCPWRVIYYFTTFGLLVQRGILIQINHDAHLKHRVCGFQVLVAAEAENLTAD